MQKSDDSDKESDSQPNNEAQKKNAEEQTARELLLIPYKASHNMDDLEILEYNSADEVRQALKSMLGTKRPFMNETEERHVSSSAKAEQKVLANSQPIKMNQTVSFNSHDTNTSKHALLRSKNEGDDDQRSRRPRNAGSSRPGRGENQRKRRTGRPPKAGPSRPIKKPTVSSMYIAKLSNVVFTERRQRKLRFSRH